MCVCVKCIICLGLLQRVGIRVDCFEDLIFTLNNESYLLKKGPKTYQLQTAG